MAHKLVFGGPSGPTTRFLSASGGIRTNETQVTAGLFIGKALQTSLNGVNLALSGASHPMQACRLYYSSILMEPDKSLLYSRQNQAKKVVFRNYYFNQINAVGAGGTYSQLIQSGIRNPNALIVVPYISSTVAGMSGYQWQSPFDTARPRYWFSMYPRESTGIFGWNSGSFQSILLRL